MRRKRLPGTSAKRGFTLIELLMVMAIMGILASLLIGAYQGSRESMRKRLAVADLERLANACEMYQSFYGELPVPDGDDTENFEIYEQLQTLGNEVRRRTKPLVWSEERRNGVGSMLDPWSRPYVFKLVDVDLEEKEEAQVVYVSVDHNNGPDPTNWDQLSVLGRSEFKLVPGSSYFKIFNTEDHPENTAHNVVADAVKFVRVSDAMEYIYSPIGTATLKPTVTVTAGSITINTDWGWDYYNDPPIGGADNYYTWRSSTGNRGSVTYPAPGPTEELYEIYYWHRDQNTPDMPIELYFKFSPGDRPVFRIYSVGSNGVDNDAVPDDIVRDVTAE